MYSWNVTETEHSQIMVADILYWEAYIITWLAIKEQDVKAVDRSLSETIMALGGLNEATMLILSVRLSDAQWVEKMAQRL